MVWARGTLIEGNFIGTTSDGMSAQPNQRGPGGVTVRDAIDTTIRGNLIAGLRVVGINHYAGQVFGDAIAISPTNGDTISTRVIGNTIGLAADGVTPFPPGAASRSPRARSVLRPAVSSLAAREQLTPTPSPHSKPSACWWSHPPPESRSRATPSSTAGYCPSSSRPPSGSDGPTPNDPRDLDTGGNMLQNFPILTTAYSTNSTTHLAGTLESVPSQTFVIEFFADTECLPSGRGQARRFLGVIQVTSSAVGDAPFDVHLPSPAQLGEFISRHRDARQ